MPHVVARPHRSVPFSAVGAVVALALAGTALLWVQLRNGSLLRNDPGRIFGVFRLSK
ncbi:MAG: hypothetical protein WAU57_10080 [Xanthobacteraceae bacterium]